MSDTDMASLIKKLQALELGLKRQRGQEVGYGRALREAIIRKDHFVEVEVLKSLGDLRLKKAKLSKNSVEFDKAAALYAAALLRCKDPDVLETLEHRIGYMEKLSRKLLQGYSPHFRWLSPDYWGTADSNVLRVAEICDKLDRSVRNTYEQTYTEALVTAVENSDMFLEVEVLKSLGDYYLAKGETTSDVSQFSKAAAMYNKALTTCGDPGAKRTLKHRILYTEKTREAVKRKPSSNKPRPREREPHMGHPSTNITTTDIIQDVHHSQTDRKREYTDQLKEGDSSLARADLDSAEKHFAAALKMVHVRDPTAQQYQREVEPLGKLGDVYSKRGQQTGDGGDFVKAVALYNAAIARSEDQVINGNMATAISEIEILFLKCILDVNCVAQDNIETHKKQLKEMRDQIKLEMETMDQQLDPYMYVHDEDDPCVREIEAKRAQAVRQLFEKIAQQRKEFISLLVEECIGLMGPPTCRYALMGLGSQATGLVTPYSDLEFAILVEEESEEYLEYFRNLTHYLHLKVVNLGETILPALAIKSLNNFYSENPLDNWYYDSVTPRGFAFDGSMPKASKTPLGRRGTMKEPPSELICTPENMASRLQKDATVYLKEGYHLATILRNPCLIAGDQDLIDTYKSITGKLLQADGGKMAQQLAQEIRKENMERTSNSEVITARLIDVKKDIYRFPPLTVDCLALSSHIIPTTVWGTIEDMENQQVISPNNAHHLTVLTSISAELRLRTYIANGGQKENLSAMASMETALQESSNNDIRTSALIPVFYLPNDQQLFRYYYTAVPLKYALQKWSEKESVLHSFPDFYDNSPRVQGTMYHELCRYEQAIRFYHEALEKTKGTDTEEKIELLNNIGQAYDRLGDHRNGIKYYDQTLQMCKCSCGQGTGNPGITTVLNNLGAGWGNLGDYRKAISYHEQALKMEKLICCQGTAHIHISQSFNNLGEAWRHLGDYRTAIHYYDQALQLYRSIYGQGTAHPDIAISLNNLAIAWNELCDYRKAVSYYEQALLMYRSLYGQSTAHPLIAASLNNLGEAWRHLGNYRKNISYNEQALQMHRSIYGQNKAHPHIATSLNNLGLAWHDLGDYRITIRYYEQSLLMRRSIYGPGTPHPDVAGSLNNLGSAWSALRDYRKAISYHEQSLQMQRSIYGEGTAHSDIAASFSNLGEAWEHLGDYKKAISYYEHALQMDRSVYDHIKVHPYIASSLKNLGSAWLHQGDSKKAISYFEQALQMYRSVHSPSTTHPDIADSLNCLGSAWLRLGDFKKAISYYEQALQLYRGTYDQCKANPDIAILVNNLGSAWHYLGDCEKAISYFEQALQMQRCLYGQGTAHPLIAGSLNNLGRAWDELGDYGKTISYYEQALQMKRSIYSTAHADIADLLNSLGTAWLHQGDFKKAISYHEQALQMFRSIYSPCTVHLNIATSLHKLGWAWDLLGNYSTAASLYQEALVMAKQVFAQDRNHPVVKNIEDSIASVKMRQCGIYII